MEKLRSAKMLGEAWFITRKTLSVSIADPTRDSKNYIMLAIKREFHLFPIHSIAKKDYIFTAEENYLKNIKIIRQLYGKEI